MLILSRHNKLVAFQLANSREDNSTIQLNVHACYIKLNFIIVHGLNQEKLIHCEISNKLIIYESQMYIYRIFNELYSKCVFKLKKISNLVYLNKKKCQVYTMNDFDNTVDKIQT